MLAPKEVVKTPPTSSPSVFDLQNIRHAIFQAEQGLKEQGVPIGAALVRNDGVVIGVGRNRRVQQKSATRHGEVRERRSLSPLARTCALTSRASLRSVDQTDCLECIGRLPASVYKDCTMYTCVPDLMLTAASRPRPSDAVG